MKKISIFLTLLLFAAVSYAEPKGELLVSVAKKGNAAELVFELLNDGGIVGVQFEVDFGKQFNTKKAKIDGCVAGAGTGLSGCNFVDNKLRFAVLDGGLQDLQTGEIGRVLVPGSAISGVRVQNLKFVDVTGNERDAEALIDIGTGRDGMFEK